MVAVNARIGADKNQSWFWIDKLLIVVKRINNVFLLFVWNNTPCKKDIHIPVIPVFIYDFLIRLFLIILKRNQNGKHLDVAGITITDQILLVVFWICDGKFRHRCQFSCLPQSVPAVQIGSVIIFLKIFFRSNIVIKNNFSSAKAL